ncbi:uncharacterized protein LOC126896076 [Daktulosphaira vitifoliae]|uniref:uncharacterized protein LOC126896076 n=1 Tax=Daktulosphaira vitifoliae TaxID=58002 RepID=UPI0021AAFB50|nr:uncharacterized protein LOC126896076 [Daktulosphaira vitifoliae]
MAENIAFSDWSEKLDSAGTNHWLPAYGLQQPTVMGSSGGGGHHHLHHGQQNDPVTFDSVDRPDYFCGDHEDDNNDDDDLADDDSWSSFNQSNYGGNIDRSTSYIFLETILEETSDDLRTDSERSSEEDFIKEDSWSISNHDPFNLFNNEALHKVYDNNDPGVHDEDDNVFFRGNTQNPCEWTPLTVGGGGGSLLQFETLEKQCEQTVQFRTTATSVPFMSTSSESLTAQRSSRRHSWKSHQQHDDCDEYDDDETMLCSTPFSSYGAGGDGSSIKSLSKSMESVHSGASKKRKRDSTLIDVSQSLEDLRRDDDGCNAATNTSTGMYKTVDCLIDPTAFRKRVDVVDGKKPGELTVASVKQQRSSENLSEDSGFGDQVPPIRAAPVVQTYKPIVEDENYFEMSTKSILGDVTTTRDSGSSGVVTEKGTSDEDCDNDTYHSGSKFSTTWCSYPDLAEQPSVNPGSPTTDDHNGMASRLPMSSTPNLCADDLSDTGDYLRPKKLLDSTASLYRSHSLKRIHYESESALSAASSRGSNLLITTSFVSLAPPVSNKGVHFCPVVSEVNWRESFSSTDEVSSAPETEEEEEEPEDNIDTMVVKLLTGLPSETRRPSLAEKQQLRERLDFITGGSPPVSHRIGGGTPTAGTGSSTTAATVTGADGRSVESRATETDAPAVTMSKSKSIGGKLGGFFQRFSLRRLSGRRSKDKKKFKADGETTSSTVNAPAGRPDTPPPPPPPSASSRQPTTTNPSDSKVTTVSATNIATVDRGKKPPLPPHPQTAADNFGTRRRLVYDENRGGSSRLPPPPSLPTAGSRASLQSRSPAATILLETDLDSNVTRTSSSSLVMGSGGGGCSPNKKARSLLDLGASSGKLSLAPTEIGNRQPVDGSPSAEYRAKSMEFLLDKENQAAVQAPENELRKGTVNGNERMLSEHELRIQRSLQRLNLPEWYKTNNVPAQGFLLKRHSDAGYTTSMSSLSSTQSQSPKGHSNISNSLLSPQTHAATKNFSRWSTSRLNGAHSTSTSPCSSTRSSFNYRQPYLGWRSQEKLSKPRTPAERLAAGLLAQHQNNQPCPDNLSEVQSSIKEVTSAIANYVSSTTPNGSKERLNSDYHDSPSRCQSLRGSTGRLCWLESSFVGNKRPSLTRDTPPSENNTPISYKSFSSINKQTPNKTNEWVNDRPSPGSTTMEDVLNSLLGLQSPNKSARLYCRRSSDNNPNHGRPFTASVSGNAKQQHATSDLNCVGALEPSTIRCRYSECQRSATVAEARRTFKTCHNCNHMYCSRRCRRAHWQDHRKTCLNRRTGTLCQSIFETFKGNDSCTDRLSIIARRGFLEQGRGTVKCHFSGIELAEKFVKHGGNQLHCEPVYVKWTELTDSEPERLEELCKNYNPDTRFVLFVSVCVQREIPGPGPVQWERHVVSRYVKLRLGKSFRATPSQLSTTGNGPDTLILTSLPGRNRGVHRSRQVGFTNIQRHLRQRGVDLRHQFPDVYNKLCEYVQGPDEVKFTPMTIYPQEKVSGKTFMCIIMPDAEPEKMRLIPEGNNTVQTIDISQEETED